MGVLLLSFDFSPHKTKSLIGIFRRIRDLYPVIWCDSARRWHVDKHRG